MVNVAFSDLHFCTPDDRLSTGFQLVMEKCHVVDFFQKLSFFLSSFNQLQHHEEIEVYMTRVWPF